MAWSKFLRSARDLGPREPACRRCKREALYALPWTIVFPERLAKRCRGSGIGAGAGALRGGATGACATTIAITGPNSGTGAFASCGSDFRAALQKYSGAQGDVAGAVQSGDARHLGGAGRGVRLLPRGPWRPVSA